MADEIEIHSAAASGSTAEVLRLLRGSPGLVGAEDALHYLPLHHAATCEVAELLIEHGADVDAPGWMGATPLHCAAENARVEVADALIRAGANVNARRTERRDTPLHWAASPSVARLLVEQGAELEARDWSGRTPLHWAAQFGHTEVLVFLIAHGARVDARSERPKSESVVERKARKGILHRVLSALARAIDAVSEDSAASPCADVYTGDTPLHWAAREGHADAARVLLAHGATVDATDADGRTPLHKAAFRGHHAVVELLVGAGADMTIRNRYGQTPLHEAQLSSTVALLLRLAGPNRPADRPLAATPAQLHASLTRLYLHPGRRELLTVARNAVLTRWNLDPEPKMLAGLQTTHPWIAGIGIAPDHTEEFFCAAPKGGIEVRRWEDLRVIRTLDVPGGQEHELTAIDVSPDNRWIAVANENEQVLLMERSSGKVVACSEGGERTAALRFDPASRLLAAACSFQGGGYVRIDTVGSDGQLKPLHKFDRSNIDTPIRHFVDTLARVAFSPDGRYLALFETSAVGHNHRPAGWRGNLVLFEIDAGEQCWMASVDACVTDDSRSLQEAGYPVGYVTDVVFANDTVKCGATRGGILSYRILDGRLAKRAVVHEEASVVALASDATNGTTWVGLDSGELVAAPSA